MTAAAAPSAVAPTAVVVVASICTPVELCPAADGGRVVLDVAALPVANLTKTSFKVYKYIKCHTYVLVMKIIS